VSTTVTAALPDQRPGLRVASPAAAPKAEAKPFEIPGTDDRFEFK
jgi:hypothetical protein